MNKPISEAIQFLIKEGGALVLSSECHPIEIADAQATDRFYVDCLGLGVVHRTQEWLDHVKQLNDAWLEKIKEPSSSVKTSDNPCNSCISDLATCRECQGTMIYLRTEEKKK